jgi:LmbE family N-acetylglucosaminyl deacetylase
MTDYSSKRILAVLAHPDDETFAVGGTLALYAHRGAQVDLICTTHGEAGDVSPEYMQNYTSIAELREAELRCAAQTLGIHEVVILNHRDSGMPGAISNEHPNALMNAPLEQVAAEIAGYIRRYRSDIVITHDPLGNYFHPDHIATQRATERAFQMAGDPDQKIDGDLPAYQSGGLYFYTMARKRLRWLLWVMPLLGMDPQRTGRNKDINMEKILKTDLPVHVEINYKEVDLVRDEASRCHASQGGGQRVMTLYGKLRRALAASKDAFMQAYPQPNGRVRKDFFE